MLVILGCLCYLSPNSKTISLLVIFSIARLKITAGMNFTLTFLGLCQVTEKKDLMCKFFSNTPIKSVSYSLSIVIGSVVKLTISASMETTKKQKTKTKRIYHGNKLPNTDARCSGGR